MPTAAIHIIIALIIGGIIRDYFVKDQKKFPLHYILLIGLGGLLPDFDIAIYWILYWFGFTIDEVHRTFTHNLFFPLLLFVFSGISWKWKNKSLGKHHLKIHSIFLMLAFGILIHLVLDFMLAGWIMPLYPVSQFSIGLNPIDFLPYALQQIFFPSLDAALIILWLVYIEWKHKISDFI